MAVATKYIISDLTLQGLLDSLPSLSDSSSTLESTVSVTLAESITLAVLEVLDIALSTSTWQS